VASSRRGDTPWCWAIAALWCLCSVTGVYAQDLRWDRVTTVGLQAFEQGDYDEAARQFEVALAIAGTFAPDDPRVARSLMNLAIVYDIQGQDTKAERFYQRALALQEKVLGPEHPQLADVLEGYVALQRKMHPVRSLLPWSAASKMAARATRIREREEQAMLQELPGWWYIDRGGGE
jgi:tetratricopeptide (TPR) repeat protein